jgi:chromosome segregation ATPase
VTDAGARDPFGELESQMQAAGELIEGLEEEVSGLRRDLEEAGEALRAARAEVAAREKALEVTGSKQEFAEEEVLRLRAELADLRNQQADEQLRLRNAHISELAELRQSMEDQRVADLEAASTDERVNALKEEIRREREATEERHEAEMEALRLQSQQWEEKLREGYTELEEQHRAETEELRRRAEESRAEVERELREEFEKRLTDEQLEAAKRQELALQSLRSGAAGRELEMQKDYKKTIEAREEQIETLRRELEERNEAAEQKLKSELREVKRTAEARENELRRAQAARISEANVVAEKRIAALQAQREADNRALMARHAEEVAILRREYEERLATEDERRKSETWGLEERLNGLRIQRETELETYRARLVELESERLSHKREAQEDLERAARGFGEEVARMESRIAELEEELEESEALRSSLLVEYEELQDRLEGREGRRTAPRDAEQDAGEDGRFREVDAERLLAEERVQVLQDQLRAAREETRATMEELNRTRESLRRLSDPEHRVRAGIELFNSSQHAATVASISRGLGLPRVHVGVDGPPDRPGKPILTFVWGDISWRRYVADPTEGVEEPRVYLVGTSNDPAEVDTEEPNARMDANGKLTLGVQAR